MEIRRLDPGSEADIDRYLAVVGAAQARDVPGFPAPCRQDFAAGFSVPWPGAEHEYWLALEGEPAVGVLGLSMPTLDNLDNVDVLELCVDPEWRRRGVGRALFAHLVERVRAAGRSRVIGEAKRLLGDGPVTPGGAFAAAMGASTALTEVRRRLELDSVDQGALDSMLVAARGKADGYSLRRWVNAAPDELVDGIAALDSSFLGEAPTGDLVLELEKVDATRVRANDRGVEARGRRMYHVVACHDATGEVVAWTTLGLNHCPDHHAWQQITLVAPKHRGHRLGLWCKLDNLAWMRAHEPAVRTIDTWNAGVNDHMIAINEAMGFRPVDAWDSVQADVSGTTMAG